MVEDVEPAVITRHRSGALQYSCQYWLDHSECSQVSLNHDGSVYRFLREYCLYWLEAMSLMGKTPVAMAIMTKLESLIDVSSISYDDGIYLHARFSRRKSLSYRFSPEMHKGSHIALVMCSAKHLFSYIVRDLSLVRLRASFEIFLAPRRLQMSEF